jgi:hypothetical protein
MPDGRFAPAELRGLGRGIWIAAVVLAGLFTVLASLFTAGYAMDDPGGLAGLALVATWFVPILIGIWLAVRMPDLAFRILVGIALLTVAIGVWQLLDPHTVRDWEFANGPVLAVASFATMLPLALAARIRLWQCALLMMVIALALLAPDLRAGMHFGSSGAVAMPMLFDASLLGLAAALAQPR